MEWHQYFDDTFLLSVGETQPNAIAVHDKKLKAQLQSKQGENKEVKFMRPDKDINIVMSNKDLDLDENPSKSQEVWPNVFCIT